jgi:hypothetical protein
MFACLFVVVYFHHKRSAPFFRRLRFVLHSQIEQPFPQLQHSIATISTEKAPTATTSDLTLHLYTNQKWMSSYDALRTALVTSFMTAFSTTFPTNFLSTFLFSLPTLSIISLGSFDTSPSCAFQLFCPLWRCW